jgi:TPR repeat protein
MRNHTFIIFSFVMLVVCFAQPLHASDDDIDITALTEAAEKGDADAQFALGSAYQMGDGVPQNDIKGAYWIKKSANQGNLDAQFNLGIVYRGGYGVSQDLITAYMWLEMAVAAGSTRAFDLRRDLSMSMTLDQIEEAKYRAKRWKPQDDSDE